MGAFRKSLKSLCVVVMSAAALHGVQACSSGTELNPQPLPPEQGSNDPTRSPTSDGDKNSGGGGATGANPPPSAAADASAEGGNHDAGDAGAD